MARLDIGIFGKDNSDQAFNNVLTNSKRLSAEMKGLGGTTKAAGQVIAAFGNTQLASAVGMLGTGILQARQFASEIGKSKIATLGLGAAVFTASYNLGDLIREWIPFVNFHDKMEKSIDKAHELLRVQNELMALRDPQKAGRQAELLAIDQRIEANRRAQDTLKGALGRGGIGPGVDDASGQLQKLREETLEKHAREDSERLDKGKKEYNEFFDGMVLKMNEVSNAELAELQAVDARDQQRLEKARELYAQKVINDDQFLNLTLMSYDLMEKEKTKISEEQSKKRKEQIDEERKKQLQSWSSGLSAAGSFFGSMAQLSESFGKKGFKMAQMFRYAEAIVNTAAGIARALAEYPWPYSIIAGAAVAAAGAVQIATIASAKPSGQAHGGLDYVPEDATYELRQGERVIKPAQNVQLQDFLDRSGGGLVSVEIYLDSQVLLSAISQASSDGRLRIDARSVR